MSTVTPGAGVGMFRLMMPGMLTETCFKARAPAPQSIRLHSFRSSR